MARRGALLRAVPVQHSRPVSKRPDDDAGRQFVGALARGLDVLRAFPSAGTSLGNQEIAEKTGLTRPTVSRMTYTLTALGYLDYSEQTGRYRLGRAAFALGYATTSGSTVQQIARPLMERVALDMDVCVILGFRDGLEVVYAEYYRGKSVLNLTLGRGARVPLATTSLGRSLLAAMPRHERKLVVERLISANEGKQPGFETRLLEAIDEYRHHGFTKSIGEWDSEVSSVAVPLPTAEASLPLALGLGGPTFRTPREKLINEIAPRLRQLASDIEDQLRHP